MRQDRHEDYDTGENGGAMTDSDYYETIAAGEREGTAPGQAERERFAAKMEMLADWFDADDFAKGREGRTEVQQDLRRWAAAARDMAAAAAQPAREQVIAKLAAAFGLHKTAVSRPADEDHRHPWTEFVPSGDDGRGSTMIVFRDTDGQNSMRALTYGEIADALCGAAAAQPDLPELYWAPYQEFGIPDPAAETYEPPAFAFRVGATGYRDNDIIIYWTAAEAAAAQPAPGDLGAFADELDRLAGEHADKAAEYDRDAAQENFHRGCSAALRNSAGRIRFLIASQKQAAPAAAPGEAPSLGTAWRLLGELRQAVDRDTRLRWQAGLDQAGITELRRQAGLEPL